MAADGPKRAIGSEHLRSGQQPEHPISRQLHPPYPIWCQPSLTPLSLATSLEQHSTPFLLWELSPLLIIEACKHKWAKVFPGQESVVQHRDVLHHHSSHVSSVEQKPQV